MKAFAAALPHPRPLQEAGRRAGTESVLLLAGLGRAADIARRELPAAGAHLEAMRDRLRQRLLERLPAVSSWAGLGPVRLLHVLLLMLCQLYHSNVLN